MLYALSTGILRPILSILLRVKVYNKERVPSEGSLVFASNHKHWLDPVMIGVFMPRKVSYMAKKELFKNKIAAFYFKKVGVFPVDRNKPEVSTIKHALSILKSGGALGIFPEGTRIKDKEDESQAKAGVAMFSIKGHSKIVPVFIDGEYKLWGPIKLHVGNPISVEEYYDQKLKNQDYLEISNMILEKIRKGFEEGE